MTMMMIITQCSHTRARGSRKAMEETTSIISCWYPPPEGGKAEAHDPQLLVLLRRMAAL
jgi:hypothetical protein